MGFKMIMYNKKTESFRKLISGITISIFILFLNFLMSCSSYDFAVQIPHHIHQRILETENTYMVNVQYLVWNEMTQQYEWEYFTDHHVGFQ
jgi:hypothetical protein